MYIWTLQKKVKIGSKVYYVFYLVNNNKIFCRLGYIMHFSDLILVKINLQKLLIFLFFFKGFLNIRESIYLKFFILCYFYLLEVNSWKKINFNS
jgi:hypothetical protein